MVVLGVMELMVLAIVLSTLLITMLAILDIARTPSAAWKAAGQIQALWLVIVLLFPVLGPVAYLIAVRGDVAAATRGIDGAIA